MRFTFAGTEYEGREGETLAAALVRHGVLGGFRSIYRGRERGVFSAGEEEPNALVQVGDEPLLRATLVPVVDGLVAEPLAGKGRLVVPTAPPRYETMHAHCDVLVVGAGRSGTGAAESAQGDLLWLDARRDSTWVVGLYDDGYAIAVEGGRRVWRIRAKRIVLATGAIERPELFADNDLPGTMLANAYEAYGRPEGARPVSGGWSPRVHLWSQRGGRLHWDDRIGAPVPNGDVRGIECVGRLTGAGLPDAPAFAIPDGDEDAMFVDLERDQTVADVRRALGAGLRSVEHVKRYTTIGTGSDQGKTGNVLAIRVAAELLGVAPGELGTTTFRPPYVPVSFALLAGRDVGPLFDPVRVTPMHMAHVRTGAVFEPVGQWQRARYYPQPGEDMDAAVLRECRAVRTAVGKQDASTLGKIDVQGPDALELLNRLYTNAFDSLAVGMCRYGVMCKADGMVFDDGVVMRVGPERYVCTTTTGNAAAVLAWMEEWLQTEWPHLRVWLTSVTEQWATVAVAGPGSRDLLQPLTDVDLARGAFPFMAIREGTVAGIPARICRVSFSGELAFEVNVDGRRGRELWDAVAAIPYGTEAMHVLRAEKGYPIIGQETDGTVTPHDLGLDWLVSKTKPDFVGKRSFARPDTSRADRRHLVGLRPDQRIDEGAQLAGEGHVTACYLDGEARPFALALLKRGRERHGETVLADGVPCLVVDPVFYDPEGARRDGA
jgi:sarcosine oxidase subunit alpha